MFRRGELGHGNLSFDRSFFEKEVERNSLPNSFIVESDFRQCITNMEEQIWKVLVDGNYDPYEYDKRLAHPSPVDERILPDLQFGYGDAKCAHTKRER